MPLSVADRPVAVLVPPGPGQALRGRAGRHNNGGNAMLGGQVEVEWVNTIEVTFSEHGELLLTITSDDGEGMDGGTFVVVFAEAAAATDRLVAALHRFATQLAAALTGVGDPN